MVRCRNAISKRPARGTSSPRISAASPIGWGARAKLRLLRRALDHAEPAEAPVGLVAGRGVIGDEPRAVFIEAAPACTLLRELHALGQQALAVGGGDHPKTGINQQHARLVVFA